MIIVDEEQTLHKSKLILESARDIARMRARITGARLVSLGDAGDRDILAVTVSPSSGAPERVKEAVMPSGTVV